MDKTLGQVIAEYRKIKQISQKELAEHCEISPQYLNDIERDRRIPSENILVVFSNFLGVDKDYLFSLAQKIPLDILSKIRKSDRETIISAYDAFRKKLK